MTSHLVGRSRTRTRLGIAGAAALLAVTLSAGAAQAAPPAGHGGASATKPTIVLVHGAWADSSSWDGVVQRLQDDGYPVRAAADPLGGLASDSASVRSFLDSIPGPKIVVGHSYGGAVVTNAAAADPDVKALVYIAAFVPDTGESLASLSAQPVAHPVPPLPVVPVATVAPDGTQGAELFLDPAKFRQAFAADVPARTAALMAATQRPLAAAAFGEVTQQTAWKTIPSWYLVAEQDQAIAPDLERSMAARAGAHTEEIDSSHAAMVSHPAAVTHLIEEADHGTR
jgi:pimeloyl-ACP methyl ester carboxylesterase